MNQDTLKVLLFVPMFVSRTLPSSKMKHLDIRICVGGSKNKRGPRRGIFAYRYLNIGILKHTGIWI